MKPRRSLDSLLALLTVTFSVLCAGALVSELWTASEVPHASARV